MSDVTVRALVEDDWATYRQLRLAALTESPDAFVSTVAEEQELDEDFWRLRMRRSTRLLAEREEQPVGVVSLGTAKPIVDVDGDSGETTTREVSDQIAELFAMWVEPSARGTGVAWRLVDAAAAEARSQGRSHVMLWVSVDNGRAVAFYSSYGFRPADARRPVRTDTTQTEMAMTLPVRDDPGTVPNSLTR
jgi:ribosomal protein S18 acetylase RimI-like enzyme